jgi:hypothetical protein
MINRAMSYILSKRTIEEYLEIRPIDDEQTLAEFRVFWAKLHTEITETKLPPGVSWEIPSDW